MAVRSTCSVAPGWSCYAHSETADDGPHTVPGRTHSDNLRRKLRHGPGRHTASCTLPGALPPRSTGRRHGTGRASSPSSSPWLNSLITLSLSLSVRRFDYSIGFASFRVSISRYLQLVALSSSKSHQVRSVKVTIIAGFS